MTVINCVESQDFATTLFITYVMDVPFLLFCLKGHKVDSSCDLFS
jgi:hypothetical protein